MWGSRKKSKSTSYECVPISVEVFISRVITQAFTTLPSVDYDFGIALFKAMMLESPRLREHVSSEILEAILKHKKARNKAIDDLLWGDLLDCESLKKSTHRISAIEEE